MNDILSRETQSDSAAEINPYQLPLLMWEKLEPYFEKQYGVKLIRHLPSDPKEVDKPVITFRISRRVPGGGRNNLGGSRGSNFEDYRRTDQGDVIETYAQRQRLTLEWRVFSISPEEADDIAWDLENAIVELTGQLQSLIPGFHLSWEQTGEPATPWETKDSMRMRQVRFDVMMPVRHHRSFPELRRIVFEAAEGRVAARKRFTRETTDVLFKIPVEDNQRVLSILSVQILRNSRLQLLQEGVDYQVCIESDRTRHLKWLDGRGATPTTGGDFVVDYEYSPQVRERTITNRET